LKTASISQPSIVPPKQWTNREWEKTNAKSFRRKLKGECFQHSHADTTENETKKATSTKIKAHKKKVKFYAVKV